jgi:hypothetical protein
MQCGDITSIIEKECGEVSKTGCTRTIYFRQYWCPTCGLTRMVTEEPCPEGHVPQKINFGYGEL